MLPQGGKVIATPLNDLLYKLPSGDIRMRIDTDSFLEYKASL